MTDPTQNYFSNIFAPVFLQEIEKLLKEKGKEYSSSGAFDNFNAISSLMGVSREEYLMTIASKHWVALVDWSKGKTTLECTALKDRIMDIIVYLTLLACMKDNQKDKLATKLTSALDRLEETK